MRRWKSRAASFAVCFVIGLLIAFIYSFIAGLFASSRLDQKSPGASLDERCAASDYFARPEDLLSALKSDEVSVRREVFRRLFLRPGVSSIYYDYERDLEYPERADRANLEYINLDESTEDEALLTFVRFDHPVALILKRESCGWKLIAALGAWLRFEEYPYRDWIELPQAIEWGTHEILVHESNGDASSYVRQARLLKLINGSLKEIAVFEEESIKPLSEYHAPDWSEVRQRSLTRFAFAREAAGPAPRLNLETTDEVIKYKGAAPAYTYWLETDGGWHAAHKNWTARPSEKLKPLGSHTKQLIWNEQEKRFV
ncbi:MAG TPA: hypothetical protein VGO91_13835 [Pyrinomonadaceae bacterium]|jgi:hypothetical protein|nr:hypothetical protein [Pyrinomonadaceae bacterium]